MVSKDPALFLAEPLGPMRWNPIVSRSFIMFPMKKPGKFKLVGGSNPSEKYEFVSWDDYFQLNGKIKNVPYHQPAIVVPLF